MANNPEHLELLRRMGVSLIHLKDGRVQLVQHAAQVPDPPYALSPGAAAERCLREVHAVRLRPAPLLQAVSAVAAEDGLRFMQEMMELSSQQQKEQLPPRAVQIVSHPFFGRVVLTAGPAQFGMDLSKSSTGVSAPAAFLSTSPAPPLKCGVMHPLVALSFPFRFAALWVWPSRTAVARSSLTPPWWRAA